MFPDVIKEFLAKKKYKELKGLGRSGDSLYEVDDKYILKISSEPHRLLKEKKINDYLIDTLPVAKSCFFIVVDNYAYYLKTKIEGEPLCSKKYLDNPDLVIKLLAEAINMFHSLDISDCKLESSESIGNTFIHGDLCLPNIIIKDNKISGFIDLANGGIGEKWQDYAWSIWSLEYNLGTNEYTKKYLDLIGIEFNKEAYDLFINE